MSKGKKTSKKGSKAVVHLTMSFVADVSGGCTPQALAEVCTDVVAGVKLDLMNGIKLLTSDLSVNASE